MPSGMRYNASYNHKRKEITFIIQIGTMPAQEIIMGAEAFLQDIEFIINDKKLAMFFAKVREIKDLPIDHDFGAGGGEIKFNPKDWEGKMGGES